eukprot:scaffold15371_cov39-Phaeocystis_antarctica.AAC.1
MNRNPSQRCIRRRTNGAAGTGAAPPLGRAAPPLPRLPPQLRAGRDARRPRRNGVGGYRMEAWVTSGGRRVGIAASCRWAYRRVCTVASSRHGPEVAGPEPEATARPCCCCCCSTPT